MKNKKTLGTRSEIDLLREFIFGVPSEDAGKIYRELERRGINAFRTKNALQIIVSLIAKGGNINGVD